MAASPRDPDAGAGAPDGHAEQQVRHVDHHDAGADRAADRLKELEEESLLLKAHSEEIRRNFTDRRGLIGVGDARERYEDAVYQFLVLGLRLFLPAGLLCLLATSFLLAKRMR